jgi:hypothetical protein
MRQVLDTKHPINVDWNRVKVINDHRTGIRAELKYLKFSFPNNRNLCRVCAFNHQVCCGEVEGKFWSIPCSRFMQWVKIGMVKKTDDRH